MCIPKGKSLNAYTQSDIRQMMDHINSYSRPSLGDKSPYEMMSFLYGDEILSKLGCQRSAPDDVTLSPRVFQKGDTVHA